MMKFDSLLSKMGKFLTTDRDKRVANKVYNVMCEEIERLNSQIHERDSRLKALGTTIGMIQTNNEKIRSNNERIEEYRKASGRS